MRKEPRPLRALLIEDCEPDAVLVLDALRRGGFEVSSERADTESKLREALTRTWDVVFCDYNLPQFDGRRAIEILRTSGLELPVIVISGAIDEEAIVEALRLGANDYVMKDKL